MAVPRNPKDRLHSKTSNSISWNCHRSMTSSSSCESCAPSWRRGWWSCDFAAPSEVLSQSYLAFLEPWDLYLPKTWFSQKNGSPEFKVENPVNTLAQLLVHPSYSFGTEQKHTQAIHEIYRTINLNPIYLSYMTCVVNQNKHVPPGRSPKVSLGVLFSSILGLF